MPESEGHEKAAKSAGMKVNPWLIVSILLAVTLVISLVMQFGVSPTGFATGTMTGQQAGAKAIEFVNTYLVAPGTTATLGGVNETHGMYFVDTVYQSQHIPLYISKDGVILMSMIADISVERNETPAEEQPEEPVAVKSDKPSVELFVMAFCPYGVQAEKALKPVVDLFGASANFTVRFIASVGGSNYTSVSSLHGLNEAKEDLRQICIQKHYSQATYWNYLMYIADNCYSSYSNDAALDACWKAAANSTGINVTQVESCAYGSEGLDLLSADEAIGNAYGVTGSPTMKINGGSYSGARTSDGYKTGVCDAFNTPPTACNQTVNNTGGTPSGSCGG